MFCLWFDFLSWPCANLVLALPWPYFDSTLTLLRLWSYSDYALPVRPAHSCSRPQDGMSTYPHYSSTLGTLLHMSTAPGDLLPFCPQDRVGTYLHCSVTSVLLTHMGEALKDALFLLRQVCVETTPHCSLSLVYGPTWVRPLRLCYLLSTGRRVHMGSALKDSLVYRTPWARLRTTPQPWVVRLTWVQSLGLCYIFVPRAV